MLDVCLRLTKMFVCCGAPSVCVVCPPTVLNLQPRPPYGSRRHVRMTQLLSSLGRDHPPRDHRSHLSKRRTALRISDAVGGATVGVIFYNSDCPVEPYNMADTRKARHIARLTKGFVFDSDTGRFLLSVITDTLGWRDSTSANVRPALSREEIRSRHRPGSAEQHHQKWRRQFAGRIWRSGVSDLAT
jgi:hypothetical protein